MAIKKIPCGGFYVDDGAIETRDGKPFLKTGGGSDFPLNIYTVIPMEENNLWALVDNNNMPVTLENVQDKQYFVRTPQGDIRLVRSDTSFYEFVPIYGSAQCVEVHNFISVTEELSDQVQYNRAVYRADLNWTEVVDY